MMDRVRRDHRRGLIALAIGIAVLVAAGPWTAAGTPANASPPPVTGATGASPAVPVAGIGAVVKWGGSDVASAASSNGALITSFTHTIDVNYAWVALDGISGPNLYTISTARLQFFYFGSALDTRDVVDSTSVPATNGSFDMQWQPGVFQYLFEGTFGLTASLLAPNGTTMWSESFYVHAQAPGSVLAVLPIVLILIGVYEAYGLAVSGRQAGLTTAKSGAKGQPKATEPPTDPPADKDAEEPSA